MARFYHVTPSQNVPAIQEYGLLPRIGERSAELGEAHEAVYLFANLGNVEAALGDWLGDALVDENAVTIIELDLEPDQLENTEGFECEWTSRFPISPSAITRLISEDDLLDELEAEEAGPAAPSL